MRKLHLAVALVGAVAGCRLSELVTAPADGRVVFTVQPSGTTTGQAITPPVLVTVLDAAGSRDTTFDGPVTIRLAVNPGGAKLSGDTIETAAAGRATFANLRLDIPGNGYALRASAPDREATVSRGFDVRSTPPPPQNQPPVASFSSSCSDLDCAFSDGSSDADGSIAARGWDFGDGGTASSQNPSHTYGSGGTYTVRLIVSDDDGAKDTTTQSVTVTAPPVNRPPSVDAGPDVTMLVGTYTLSAAFADPDGDDGPYTYSIDWGDGTSGGGSTSASPITEFHLYAIPGTYRVRVTVDDRHGAGGSDEVIVTIVLQ